MPAIDELVAIQKIVSSVSQQENWAPGLTYQVELIIEELCINVINHGKTDGTQPIKLAIESDHDAVTIEILDNGKPFNPTKNTKSPLPLTEIEGAEVGGWGVHLARVFSDEMHYERIDGMNCLTLVKRRHD
jgi:anti-sigma regulatory factor (Ser/Thr protein kinase)